MALKMRSFITVTFQFSVVYAITKIQANQGRLKLTEVHQFLVNAVMFIYWAKTNKQALLVDSKKVCP
jgi:hypothetical protein